MAQQWWWSWFWSSRTEPPPPVKDVFEEALKLGEVKVAYGRVMFIGEAGAGKSSLVRTLMNKPLSAEPNSTVMADTKEVKCQWIAATKDDDWKELTEDDELKELAILAKSVIKMECQSSILKNLRDSNAAKIFLSAVPAIKGFFKKSVESADSKSFQDEAFKALSIIKDTVKTLVNSDSESTTMSYDQYLNIWDCGGQRVFLDVLPAFLTSRTMFFLMFNASKDLQEKKLPVVWNKNGCQSLLETLDLSRQDLLIQWMSCIHASLSPRAEIFYRAQVQRPEHSDATVPSFPRIIIIGTHGDKINSGKKDDIISGFRSVCHNQPFSDQVTSTIIMDTTKKANVEDSEIKEVKAIVRNFVSNALCIPTPIAWVLFRKLFVKLTKSRPIVSLQNTEIIARACSIDDNTLLGVLSFYHELGAFLHYADISSLRDVVIGQPEWLVKHIGAILSPDAGNSSSADLQNAWRLLRENGILVDALYSKVWTTNEVTPQAFADLLDHCHLIAKLMQDVSDRVPRNYGKTYFMPCVLPICPDGAIETPPDGLLTAAPLHLTFSTKYVPPGFFARLATILSKTKGFSIVFKKKMYSNQITYLYGEDEHNGQIDDVTIYATHSTICVAVVRRGSCRYVEKYNFNSTCRSILKVMLGAVYNLYQWFPSIKVMPEFECVCSGGPFPHFANVSTEAESLTPLVCTHSTRGLPSADQQLWLKIPLAKDQEGVVYKSEIEALLNELDDKDLPLLAKALEIYDSNDRCLLLDNLFEWSCTMENLARSHLAYHLRRINFLHLAQRINCGRYPKHSDESSHYSDPAHVYSLVTDEELTRCSLHINGDADLSILAAYLCISVEKNTSPSREALSMLISWKKQQQSQAYRHKLIAFLAASGKGFEKAKRVLSGDGPVMPDMKSLMTSMDKDCAPDWYRLGLQLDIPDSALQVIVTDHHNNCEEGMQKMLQKWLDICANPTWRAVVIALRKIDRNELAKRIEQEYC